MQVPYAAFTDVDPRTLTADHCVWVVSKTAMIVLVAHASDIGDEASRDGDKNSREQVEKHARDRVWDI
jgi:hypothetical protein